MSFDERDPRDWDVVPEGFTVRKVKREDLPRRYPYFPGERVLSVPFSEDSLGFIKRPRRKYRQERDWDSFADG